MSAAFRVPNLERDLKSFFPFFSSPKLRLLKLSKSDQKLKTQKPLGISACGGL